MHRICRCITIEYHAKENKQNVEKRAMSRLMDIIKERMREKAFFARACACMCAVFGLFFLPLAYRNYFFDINRYKVELVVRGMPVFAVLMIAACIYARREMRTPVDRGMKCILAALGCFAVASIISSALRGFEQPVIDGSEGRYSGMFFLLCCAAMFYIIALGGISGRFAMHFAVAAAALAALLGLINAHGLDPLGFYARMRPEQIHLFISTIGNVDFYGGYLVIILPLAAGSYVFCSDKRRFVALACAMVIMMGIPVSRTDSTYFAMHFALLVLFALSGNSCLSMMKASLLCALAWGILPLINQILMAGSWEYRLFGVLAWFCESKAVYVLCALFLLFAVLFACRHRRSAPPPGRKRLVRLFSLAFVVCLVLLCMAILYFTVIDSQTDLGFLSQILRFDDYWGSRRGFVYIRSLRALADYSPMDILFGRGVDLTKRVLRPYFDAPEITRLGVFNDAHCQPLQFLLTMGVMGALSFVAFHVMLMIHLYRDGFNDTCSLCILCALTAYVPVALLHVAQPILLSVYFAVAALGASRLIYLKRKGESHES